MAVLSQELSSRQRDAMTAGLRLSKKSPTRVALRLLCRGDVSGETMLLPSDMSRKFLLHLESSLTTLVPILDGSLRTLLFLYVSKLVNPFFMCRRWSLLSLGSVHTSYREL